MSGEKEEWSCGLVAVVILSIDEEHEEMFVTSIIRWDCAQLFYLQSNMMRSFSDDFTLMCIVSDDQTHDRYKNSYSNSLWDTFDRSWINYE